MKKRVVILATSIVVAIALILAAIFILPNLLLTKEERVLRDFMGEYVNVGYARMVDGVAKTMPLPDNHRPAKSSYYYFNENSVLMLCGGTVINTQSAFLRTAPLKYRCVKVDSAKEEGLHNYITSEPFYQPTDEDVYAIYVLTPDQDEIITNYKEQYKHSGVYYVVGDKYYVSYYDVNYELEKVV